MNEVIYKIRVNRPFHCESLTSVTVPSHTEIGEDAFPSHTQIIRK